MNRIDRLFALLTTLQSRKFATAEFIAEKYGISVRTAYRDLKALGETGVPIGFESQKGYFILKGFFLPPVSLTSDEANALILMASLSEKFAGSTIRKNSDMALSKIKAVLKTQDRDKADFLHSQIRIYRAPEEKNGPDWLADVQAAIVHRHILNVTYKNNDGIVSTRDLEPIGLSFYSNQWHVIAWCWNRRAYRDFKIAALSRVANTGNSFRKTDHYDINEYIRSLS